MNRYFGVLAIVSTASFWAAMSAAQQAGGGAQDQTADAALMQDFMPGARTAAPPRGLANEPAVAAVDPLAGQGAADLNQVQASAPNRMFLAIDLNNDGIISAAELRRAAASLKVLDADNDGNITLAEVAPLGPVGAADAQFGEPNQMVDQLISQNDKNGDGQLTPNEVPAQFGRMFGQWDANGDGIATREELAAALVNMQMQMGGMVGRGGMSNAEVERGIMQFDRNRDGRLTPDEVPPQMAGMLQGADQNGDGAIDAREMAAAMAMLRQRMGGRGFPGDMPLGDPRGRGPRGGQ